MPTELPKNVIMQMPQFVDLIAPLGFLDGYRESHALWYYYTIARRTYEEVILDPIVLEGEQDPAANFRQMFIGVARAYGVEPEAMAKCWPQVDMQCTAMGYPKLPDEQRYRYSTTIQIN